MQELNAKKIFQVIFFRMKSRRGADFVESEGIGVVSAEAGRIVGNGLIAGPGLLQGFYGEVVLQKPDKSYNSVNGFDNPAPPHN
ncbi:MAG: hypothetical protein D3908_07490 [Candidatus Electrothrix sp. AUS4]|nr:hypothetical protein [Candidatus Electrothrix sp. AUS4]